MVPVHSGSWVSDFKYNFTYMQSNTCILDYKLRFVTCNGEFEDISSSWKGAPSVSIYPCGFHYYQTPTYNNSGDGILL